MLFKIIKKTAKLLIAVCLATLLFQPQKLESIIDCDPTDGSISVIGNELPVDGSIVFDTYTELEKQASSLVPHKVSRFLSEISEWLRSLLSQTG